MTQEPDRQPSTSKRSARSARNRPVLVTPTAADSDTSNQSVQVEQSIQEPIDSSPVEEMEANPAPRTRRLPGFFSSVSRSDQGQETQESDKIQARLARAIRGKASSPAAKTTTPAKKPEVKEPVKANTPATSRSTPARSTSGFKFRYIYGMILYLIIADFVGVFEANFLHANKLDFKLTQIGPFPISTSTVAFLVTLVVILLILAYFDLIPRNLSAMAGQTPQQRKPGQSQSTAGTGSVKSASPTMKQGVQGADDDLYQEYRVQQRYNQRRARKR